MKGPDFKPDSPDNITEIPVTPEAPKNLEAPKSPEERRKDMEAVADQMQEGVNGLRGEIQSKIDDLTTMVTGETGENIDPATKAEINVAIEKIKHELTAVTQSEASESAPLAGIEGKISEPGGTTQAEITKIETPPAKPTGTIAPSESYLKRRAEITGGSEPEPEPEYKGPSLSEISKQITDSAELAKFNKSTPLAGIEGKISEPGGAAQAEIRKVKKPSLIARMADAGLSSIPGVGGLKAVVEAVRGKNLITGEDVGDKQGKAFHVAAGMVGLGGFKSGLEMTGGKFYPSAKEKASAEAQEQREKTMEGFREKRGGMFKRFLTSSLVSNGIDFIPFAGDIKMMLEAAMGKTLDGRKLTGTERIIHGSIATVGLVLEFFPGVGTAISEGGLVAGKSATWMARTAGFLGKKGAPKAAEVFVKTGAFMAKHPEIVLAAEKAVEMKLKDLSKQVKNYSRGKGGAQAEAAA